MKRFFRRIFSLPPLWTAVPSFLLMILSVGGVITNPAVVYASYLLATYALILVLARLPAVARAITKGFFRLPPVRFAMKNFVIHRMVTDPIFRAHVSLAIGLAINLVYAVIKFGFGIRQRSSWLVVLGVYYTVLAAMKFSLLSHIHQKGIREDIPSEWRRYRICGIVLAVMNLVLIVMVLHILNAGAHASYPGTLIYAMAFYAFYSAITALTSLLSAKKQGSPIYSAAKYINMTAALVSMLSLTTAMLVRFGGADGPGFSRMMNAAVGGGVCTVVFVMSVSMILRSSRALKEY